MQSLISKDFFQHEVADDSDPDLFDMLNRKATDTAGNDWRADVAAGTCRLRSQNGSISTKF